MALIQTLKSAARAFLFLCLFGSVHNGRAASGCAGTLDPSFVAPFVYPTALGVDGDEAIVAGYSGLIRLRQDGSLDLDFTVTVDRTNSYAQINVIKKDAQNRILIGGDFTAVRMLARPGIARLHSNGRVDESFAPATFPAGTNVIIRAVALQSDGKIIVAGHAATTNTPQGFVVRLTAGGGIDATFAASAMADNAVEALAVQPDGKILVGGSFTNFAGQPRNQFCRLLPDGAVDESFNPARLMPLVSGITIVEDQKILAYWSGRLIPYDADLTGVPTNALVRFNQDGTTDKLLGSGAKYVSNVAIQPDGKYILGGRFWSSSQYIDYYKRILPSGEADPTFKVNAGHGTVFGENGMDGLVELDSQNRVIVGGPFTVVNGILKALARLLNDNQECVPVLSFPTNRFEFVETNGVISIPIVRTGNLETTVAVGVVSTFLSIPPFADVKTNFVFAPGVAQQNLLINITDDTVIGRRQAFQIYLTNQTAGAVFGANRVAQVSIADSSTLYFPGAVDTNFFVSLGNRPFPYTGPIAIMPDGKIVIAFGLNSVNGAPTPAVARINFDGSLDTSFLYTATNQPGLLAVSGDKLYVASPFDRPLIRLLANGSEDPSFAAPSVLADTTDNSSAFSIIGVDKNGGVLVSGAFTNINGIARPHLARIKADGVVDTAFNPATAANITYKYSRAIFALPDGTYLVGGPARLFETEYYPLLTHLSASGEILPDFQIPNIPLDRDEWAVNSIARQSDGSVLVAGYFDEANMPPRRLLRFDAAGNLDTSFSAPEINPGTLFIQPDDKIIVASGSAVRLNKEGSLDPSFVFTEGGYSAVITMDGAGNIYMRASFLNYANYAMPGLLRMRTGNYSGPGVVELEAPEEVFEDEGSIKLTIRRTVSTQGEARVRVRTIESSYLNRGDYVPLDAVVVFADGEGGEKQVQVALVNNPQWNGSYSGVEAYLTAESPGLAVGPDYRRTVSIADKGTGFYLEEARLTYEQFGVTAITIRRFGDYSKPATVELVVGPTGNATPGADYESGTRIIQFDAAEGAKEILIPIVNDEIVESDETFEVKLQNPSEGLVVANASATTFTIHDDADHFAFVEDPVYAIQEHRFAQVLIEPKPRYSGRPSKNVTLSYKTDGGTALPGVEYVAQEGEITFTAGFSNPKEILIPLLANSIVGEPTTIRVTVSSLTPEVGIENPTATIVLRHPRAAIAAGAPDPSFSLNIAYPLSMDSLIEVGNYYYAWETSLEAWFKPSRVSRYFKNGVRDESFEMLFPDGSYASYNLIPLANGQILMAGYNYYKTSLVRLKADLSIDETFHADLPALSFAYQVLAAPEGKLIVSGLVQLGSEGPSAFIRRLNADGSTDASFRALEFVYQSNSPLTVAQQDDGRILIAGGFTNLNGFPRRYLARLMPDGEIDASFTPAANLRYPGGVMAGANGKVFVVGEFETGAQTSTSGVARLNSDGSFDDWVFERNDYDNPFVLATDHKNRLYVGVRNIVRYLPTGEVDPTFTAATSGYRLFPTSDSLIVVSAYGEVQRLYLDPPTAMRAPELLANGGIAHTFNFPANTAFILEETSDFMTWTEVRSGSSTDGYVRLETVTPDSTRFYRVRSAQ